MMRRRFLSAVSNHEASSSSFETRPVGKFTWAAYACLAGSSKDEDR
jgi:hypothetical protein